MKARRLGVLAPFCVLTACAANGVLGRHSHEHDAAAPPVDSGKNPSHDVEASTGMDASTDGSLEDGRARFEGGSVEDASTDRNGPRGLLPGHPTPTRLRVAHFATGTPAIHACVRAHGASASESWIPVTGSAAVGGLPNGLASLQVTAYVEVPAGDLDVRVVAAAGGISCASHLLAERPLPPLVGNAFGTVLVRGSGANVDVEVLMDVLDSDPKASRVRVVHAAVGLGPVDVFAQGCTWIAGGASYDSVVASAAPNGECDVTAVDAAGYATMHTTYQWIGSVASVFDSDTGVALDTVAMPAALAPFRDGAVETLFVHGDSTAASGLGFTLCEDHWPSLDALSTCMPARRTGAGLGSMRFAVAIVGSSDVCLKLNSGSLRPWAPGDRRFTGLGYLSERSITVPAGIEWTVAVVPEGAACDDTTTTAKAYGGHQTIVIAFIQGLIALPGGGGLTSFLATPAAGDPGIMYYYGYDDPQNLLVVGQDAPIPWVTSAPLSLYTSQLLPDYSYGPPIRSRQTALPVGLNALLPYSLLFAAKSGSEPTDVMICDLEEPPLDAPPTPCTVSALDPVP